MLTDPEAIRIISEAQQKNVRNPGRKRAPFERILKDFFRGKDLAGQRVVDLGPGQFDFGVLLRERGAEVVGLDRDPAVLKLGEYLGFEAHRVDFQSAEDLAKCPRPFDGMFCKFSINAFWSTDAQAPADMLEARFLEMLQPEGWGWIAPWNGVAGNDVGALPRHEHLLDLQKQLFREAGFSCVELNRQNTSRYGVHGKVENNLVFFRGLTLPRRLRGAQLF